VDAYLIELRTIAGLSGSPVFVVPPDIKRDGDTMLFRKGDDAYLPLGVLVGYHVVATEEDQIKVPRHASTKAAGADDLGSLDERNTGFGVVVPIERVVEVLENPETVSAMKKRADEFKKNTRLRPASVAADQLPDDQIEKRREAVLKTMLDTPPKPNK
jgi:hypothetical protein